VLRRLLPEYILELLLQIYTPSSANSTGGTKAARTFNNRNRIIRTFPITWQERLHLRSTLQLPLEEVAFVEEEDDGALGKDLGAADSAPEEEGVFEAVDSGVFEEALVEAGYRWCMSGLSAEKIRERK